MPEAERTLLGARVMIAAFNMSGYAGWSAVGSIGDETIAIARASGDPGAIVDALVLFMQTEIMTRGGRQTDGLRAAGMEALQLATDLDDPFRLSTVLTGLAMIDAQTDPEAANGLARAGGGGRPTKRESRPPSRARSRCAGGSRAASGRDDRAQHWFREAAERTRAIGDDRFTMSSQSELAHALRRTGAIDEADAEYRQTIVGWQRSGNRGAVANQLEVDGLHGDRPRPGPEGGSAAGRGRSPARSVGRPDDRRRARRVRRRDRNACAGSSTRRRCAMRGPTVERCPRPPPWRWPSPRRQTHQVVLRIEFAGEIWLWRGPAPYHFITVPDDGCADLRAIAPVVSYGWGMIPATVRIGRTVFETALWPKDGGYVVPIKDVVRAAEALALGDIAAVELTVRT